MEGGAYATGNIANTVFNLDVYYKGLVFGASVSEDENPFDYEYGVYYWYYVCNFKKFSLRHFRWKAICDKTPVTKKVLGHGSLIKPRHKELWSWEHELSKWKWILYIDILRYKHIAL